MSLLIATGYGLAALLLAILALLLLTSWRGRLQGGLLVLATLVSALWAALLGLEAGRGGLYPGLLWAAEAFRSLAWVGFLGGLIIPMVDVSSGYGRFIRLLRNGTLILCSLLALPIEHLGVSPAADPVALRFLGHLLVAVVGLALIEQLYRNMPPDQRSGIKHLCLGLGSMFAYDFALYSDALLFMRMDPDLSGARGLVNALILPFIAVSAARNPHWSISLFVSRKAAFHTTAVVGAGMYMLVMASAGQYLNVHGGQWGGVLQIVFLCAAGLILLALLFSGQLRARLHLLLGRHFHRSHYDYRDEWFRLVSTLAGQDSESHLFERVIRALGEIVDSPAGLLWLCQDSGQCSAVAGWNRPLPHGCGGMRAEPTMEFFRSREWVVSLDDELEGGQPKESPAPVPLSLRGIEDAWLAVPLVHQGVLQGVVVLTRPHTRMLLNWEDLHLIKTAAGQAAGYLAHYLAAKSLAEHRQFEGFNRLSAYVIHDLKNLIAQLSLVARNARRHADNPEFLTDAVKTIDNSVAKMTRLMAQLQSDASAGKILPIDLARMLTGTVRERAAEQPAPRLEVCDDPVWVEVEVDRLAAVVGHVVQNAQQATPPDGDVWVRLRATAEQAIVEIRDNGSGMDETFVREHLFRPFFSTKGLTGMGMGAYECREFVESMSGNVEVHSAEGQGTCFTIRLPKVDPPQLEPVVEEGAS
jgi:putative PEP-CTERM system histidine kinase